LFCPVPPPPAPKPLAVPALAPVVPLLPPVPIPEPAPDAELLPPPPPPPVVPDLTKTYHIKICITQDTQDLGFFDVSLDDDNNFS
jgi:hypothetical protein